MMEFTSYGIRFSKWWLIWRAPWPQPGEWYLFKIGIMAYGIWIEKDRKDA